MLVSMYMQASLFQNGHQRKTLNRIKMAKSNKQSDDNTLLAISNPADIAIESIRGLRTSLHFAMMESRNNVLMISGASPNAGKTFISSNLAAIIAQAGKKYYTLMRICEKVTFIIYLINQMKTDSLIIYLEK